MANVNSIRSFWNEKAKENAYWFVSSAKPYDQPRDLEEFWQSGNKIWQVLKSTIGYRPSPSDCVVEIGCGVGRLSRVIAPEVLRLESFDISEEMLAIAKQANLRNAFFHSAEGFGLSPLRDSSADLVLSYCVFQHLPSVEALSSYLAEMTRVAKSGALLAFSLVPRLATDNLMPLLRARAFVREKINRTGPSGIYRKEWAGIRPSASEVHRIAPIPLKQCVILGDQWLFFGTKP